LRVQDTDVIGNQLKRVRIARGDNGLETLRGGLCRQGTQQVVRLIALLDQDRNAEGVYQLVDAFQLRTQVVRRLRPGRLVLVIGLMAKGAARIKGGDYVVWLHVRDSLQQDVRKAKGRVAGLTFRRGQRRDGVVGAVRQRMAIQEQQLFLVAHRCTPWAAL